MKAEGTITLKVRVSAEVSVGDSVIQLKAALIKAGDTYVRDNKLKPTVTDILIKSVEDDELPPVDATNLK